MSELRCGVPPGVSEPQASGLIAARPQKDKETANRASAVPDVAPLDRRALAVRRASVTQALQALVTRPDQSARGSVTVLDRAGLEKSAGDSYGVPETEYRRLLASNRKYLLDRMRRLLFHQLDQLSKLLFDVPELEGGELRRIGNALLGALRLVLPDQGHEIGAEERIIACA
jgi:hypothetical protein